jgi:crotonobetainyl-CoA:carnitine CoA-transferase CaiB-like acyl-CoA transferase
MLQGLKVVELSTAVPAAWCARQFALWSAEVVMIEPPEGAPLRRAEPRVEGRSGARHSVLFETVAANKRTLSSAALGDGGLTALLGTADVFVTDCDDAALSAYGVNLAGLRRALPGLVVTSITPFGLSGPYASWRGGALIVEALSGYMSLNGDRSGPPLRAPGHLTDFTSGVNGFVGTLAALLKRQRTGWGDLVEASDMEALSAFVPFLRAQYMLADKGREGGTDGGLRQVRCADGWVSAGLGNAANQPIWQDIFGIPDDAWPAGLYDGEAAEIVAKTQAFLAPRFQEKTAEEMFRALQERAVVCGMALSPTEVLSTLQLAEREFFRPLQHPDLGLLRTAGPPGRLSSVAPVPPGPAPRLEDSVSPADLAWTARPTPRDPVARTEAPLHGVRVVDLTQAWIGPYATMMMGDLGAEIVKIEYHKRPDVWRRHVPNPPAITNPDSKPVNRSHYYNSANRNKHSVSLNLQAEEGKTLFKRLVRDADVVAENYTAHVMGRLGLDYAALSAVNDDLVMLSSSGFGKTGPWNAYRTNGSAIEGLAGWDALHGYVGGPPILMGFFQADPICGLQMCSLILALLLRRERGGGGCYVEGAMLEAAAGYMADVFLEAQLGVPQERSGNRDRNAVPSGVYPCAGEDRWIAIQAPDEAAWEVLAAATGIPELAGPDYAIRAARAARQDRLDELLSTWTRGQDAEALMTRLQAQGVPAGVVRGVIEALDEPHLSARDWFHNLSRPDIGAHMHNGFAWRFANAALPPVRPPPRLGEHSSGLLRSLLGLDDAAIDHLLAMEVTGSVI